MSTAAGKRWMGKVAGIGCIFCRLMHHGETPAQVHHIREGRIARNDFLTLPACPEHHTGTAASVHMAKANLMRQIGLTSEFDVLALVIEIIEGESK